MKLEKLSALAELVSSIAIVLTLVYLAIQTQQNTDAVHASVRQAMLAEDRELMFKIIDNPYLTPSQIDSRNLTKDQQLQFDNWLIIFFRARENHWLQYQAGVIDEATWETYRFPIRLALSSEPGREQWQLRSGRGEFAQGFVDDVNAFIANED
jgi:hypothetical protein